jgi:hypothetical protein
MLKFNYERSSELPETIYGDELSKQYGSMNFAIGELESRINEPMLFHIYVDVSASMMDIVSKQQTKMTLVKHTIVNILHHFADNPKNVYVQLKGFDDRIHNFIAPVLVSNDNINDLLKLVERLRPMNSTDISLVLNELNKDVDTDYFKIPKHNRIGIVLTDGEPTSGICNVDDLVDIVRDSCSYHFIALGNEHNDNLMYKLGHKNCYTSNWFIDDIEHTGNVYGEIVFNELHRVYYDNVIHVTGGKVYDYTKGEFCDKMELGTLSEETDKHFHLLIEDESIFEISISGKLLDNKTNYLEKTRPCSPPTDGENIKITKQFLRLCVQKLMFETREEKNTYPEENYIHLGGLGGLGGLGLFPPYPPPPPPRKKQKIYDLKEEEEKDKDVNESLKDKVYTFYEFITNFIKTRGLEQDDFMIELLKDINVMKNGLDDRHVLKYVSAREDSQGRQRAFNTASQYEDDNSGLIDMDPFGRQPTSAYKTPRRCDLMREISGNVGGQELLAVEVNSQKLNIINPNKLSPNTNKLSPPKLMRQIPESFCD